MQKVKSFKCPTCGKKYQSLQTWSNHVTSQHPETIPEGFTPARYFYFIQTGKTGNKCIICKKPTEWNEATGKYERFCKNPQCKEKYREIFKQRMINSYGKVTLLNDPEQQRKMLEAKKSHGEITFSGGYKVGYNSSYEKDFLIMLRDFLKCNSSDIMGPSPHTYYYDYKNPDDYNNEGRKFYIPDYWIPSLNLEIEIKQNTSTHPKIIAIDKVKEAQKDEMMKNVPGVNYIKIVDMDYSEFFDYLIELKENFESNKPSSAMEGFSALISDIPRNTDETISNLKSLVNRLGNWRYGFLDEYGHPTDDFGENDEHFEKCYKSLRPSEFGRHKIGICWDYAAYIRDILNKQYHLACQTYYIKFGYFGDHKAATHTFVVLPLDAEHFIYIEASWKSHIGVYQFEKLDDVISTMIKWQNEDCGTSYKTAWAIEYNPENFYGMNPIQFEAAVEYNNSNKPWEVKLNENTKLKTLFKSELYTVAHEGYTFNLGQLYDYDIAEEGLFDFFKGTNQDKDDILTSWFDKLFKNEEQALVGKTPPTTSKYVTFSKVIVDDKSGIISIQNINIPLLIRQIRETFGEKRLDYIFDRTYTAHDIKRYNRKKISRSQMKITSLQTDVFFALELTIIFKELYKKYRNPRYAQIANSIYKETWLAKSDRNVPVPINLGRLKNFNPKYTPQPHQIEFIKQYPKLRTQLNLRGYYLAFDQGLGKTLTASALAEVREADHVYIVCPNTLCQVWRSELFDYFGEKYKSHICDGQAPDNPGAIKYFIVNLESIKNILPYTNLPGKKMLIVDEAHNFRNWGGARVGELVALREKMNPEDVLLLSGTPIKAAPNEAVPALKLLDPLFTDHAADTYNTCFKFDSYLAMDIVKRRFGQIIYRKTKEEVLQLPQKTIANLDLTIANSDPYLMENVGAEVKMLFKMYYEQMSKDDEVKRQRLDEIIEQYSTASSDITRRYLRMLIAKTDRDADPFEDGMHEIDKAFFESYLDTYVKPNCSPAIAKEIGELERTFIRMKNSAMGKAVGQVYPPRRAALFNSLFDENKSLIENMIESNTKKTVIFSQFLPTVKHITEVLNADGIKTVCIVGGMSNRMDVINQFRHDDSIQVIVATSQTMGTGVTLIEANQMFFFGPPWRSTDYDQCCDRIYRIGQTSDVNIYNVRLDTPKMNLSDRMDKILNWSSQMFHSAIDNDQVDGVIESCTEALEVDDVPDEIFFKEAEEYFSSLPNFNNGYDISNDIAIEAAGYSKECNQPVFIILTVGHSPLSGIIMKATGDQFSHSSISFDISLNPMYSFGTKKLGPPREMGFVQTYPQDPDWDPVIPTPYSIYVTFVNKAQLEKMKSRLEFFIKNSSRMQYSFTGLFRVFFHLKSPKRLKWFCSAFVAEVLGAGMNVDKDSTLYRPQTLQEIENVEFLIKGDAIDKYDINAAKQALERIKKAPQAMIAQEVFYNSNELDLNKIHHIVNKIHSRSVSLEKDPVGNQNCMLCTWCCEMQCRGVDILPRPVYSPRDKIFTINGYDFVKNAKKIDFNSKNELKSIVQKAGPGARFYIHVNWKGHSGGHEFLIMNIKNSIYLVDAQAGVVIDLQSKQSDSYFNIEYKNSYLVRLDDKEINQNVIKYNYDNYLIDWNEKKDISYMKKHGMLPANEAFVENPDKPEILYHGTSKKLTILDPKESQSDGSNIDREMYSYATTDRAFALCYAGKQWDDFDINQSYYNGKLYMVELRPGILDTCFNLPGYVYHVKADKFKQRRSHPIEWITTQAVQIEKEEKIPNVLKALRSAGVVIYQYPKLPPFIKDRAKYLQTKADAFYRLYHEKEVYDELQSKYPDLKFSIATEASCIDCYGVKTGVRDKNGIWNSIEYFDGKKYRERVEVLIFDKDKVYIAAGKDGKYKIPGGSTEPTKTYRESVISESQEEAMITPKNIEYCGSYIVEFNNNRPKPKWLKDTGIDYVGYNIHLFKAEYGGKYTGHIDEHDLDPTIAKGSFVPIKDILPNIQNNGWWWTTMDKRLKSLGYTIKMNTSNINKEVDRIRANQIATEALIRTEYEWLNSSDIEKKRYVFVVSNDLDYYYDKLSSLPAASDYINRYNVIKISWHIAADYCASTDFRKDSLSEFEYEIYRGLDKLTADDTVAEMFAALVTSMKKFLNKHRESMIFFYGIPSVMYYFIWKEPILRIGGGTIPVLIRNHKYLKSQIKELRAYKDTTTHLKGLGTMVKDPTKIELYHVSEAEIDVLTPRPTATAMDNENTGVARISASPHVDYCFKAIGGVIQNKKPGIHLYRVYKLRLNKESKIFIPNRKAVPDVNVTHEHWVLTETLVDLITSIYTVNFEDRKQVYFIDADSERTICNHRFELSVETDLDETYMKDKTKLCFSLFDPKDPGQRHRGGFAPCHVIIDFKNHEFTEVFTHEKYRRKGLTYEFMKYLRNRFDIEFIEVESGNYPAFNLYTKLGFREIKRKKDKSAQGGELIRMMYTPKGKEPVGDPISLAAEAFLTKASFGGLKRKEFSKELYEKYKTRDNLLIKTPITDQSVGAMFFDKDDMLKAYVTVIDGTIRGLWVDPSIRRNGYGQKLFNMSVNSYGANSIMLHRPNLNAINLFKKMGWEIYKENPNNIWFRVPSEN